VQGVRPAVRRLRAPVADAEPLGFGLGGRDCCTGFICCRDRGRDLGPSPAPDRLAHQRLRRVLDLPLVIAMKS
jgi:hypothetical protein